MKQRTVRGHWVCLVAAWVSVAVGCHRPHAEARVAGVPGPNGAASRRPLFLDDPLERLAAERPLEFLKHCREHYVEVVHDYTCRFHLQERIDVAKPVMGPVQQIDIRFREHPYSVDMRWTENAVHAARVNYVAGRWRRNDRDLALIVPSGWLGLLAPTGVRLDIRSPEVCQASSRPIDDFGFKRTLESIINRCETAAGTPGFDLRGVGVEPYEGRPCLVLERRLPYDGPGGPYPDRLLVIYIDREWLVPTGCFAYADDEGAAPIGIYETKSVRFNVGLNDDDF